MQSNPVGDFYLPPGTNFAGLSTFLGKIAARSTFAPTSARREKWAIKMVFICDGHSRRFCERPRRMKTQIHQRTEYVGTFTKATGESRTMRFTTSETNLQKRGLITVYDVENRGLRKFNLSTLIGRIAAVAPATGLFVRPLHVASQPNPPPAPRRLAGNADRNLRAQGTRPMGALVGAGCRGAGTAKPARARARETSRGTGQQ